MLSRGKQIFSLLNIPSSQNHSGNANTRPNKARRREKTDKPIYQNKDIPGYVTLFDKGKWEELDSILRKGKKQDSSSQVIQQNIKIRKLHDNKIPPITDNEEEEDHILMSEEVNESNEKDKENCIPVPNVKECNEEVEDCILMSEEVIECNKKDKENCILVPNVKECNEEVEDCILMSEEVNECNKKDKEYCILVPNVKECNEEVEDCILMSEEVNECNKKDNENCILVPNVKECNEEVEDFILMSEEANYCNKKDNENCIPVPNVKECNEEVEDCIIMSEEANEYNEKDNKNRIPVHEAHVSDGFLVINPFQTTVDPNRQTSQKNKPDKDDDEYFPDIDEYEETIRDNSNVKSLEKNRESDSHAVEVPCSEDEENNEIIISQVAKHENGKRSRKKFHCCKFCQKLVVGIGRHIQNVHKEEMEVAKLLTLTHEDRKTTLEQIEREGDFYYNKEVIATGKGELILVRRPTALEIKTHTYVDYGPCTYCLGFMLKVHLWHHVKYGCKAVNSNTKTAYSVKLGSESLLAAGLREQYSDDFEYWVIGKLNKDDVGQACKQESVILQYGDYLFQKNLNISAQQRGQNVRSAMRALISLYLKVKENLNTVTFSDILDPQRFDKIITIVKSVCQYENISKNDNLKSPSAAIRLGLELVKVGEFVHGLFIKKGDTLGEKKLKRFIHLVKSEWNVRISATARSTLEQRKYNTAELLPLTSDLIKLSMHLDNVCEQSKRQLEEGINPAAYRRLSEALLSRIILFNKRRSGESARMKLYHFLNRGSWREETTEELKKSMAPTERQLADKLTLIYTKGKRRDKVPVLLTEKMKVYLELLIKSRLLHGIDKENEFIFARPYPSETPLRGHECLKKCCIEAGLVSSERITGTKLRKYIATVTQVFNLTENETDWLAKHLGHDLHVHRQFYRLHESAVELTKVSRLLLTIDKGKANKFAGKALNEIDVDDLTDVEEDDEEVEDGITSEEADKHKEKGEENCIPLHEAHVSDGLFVNNLFETTEDLNRQTSPKKKPDKDDDEYFPDDDEFEEDIHDNRNVKSLKKNRKPVRHTVKVPWSAEEKQAVLGFFRSTIIKGQPVHKIPAEKCIASNIVLKKRSWLNVRDFVRNHIRKIAKTKQSSN